VRIRLLLARILLQRVFSSGVPRAEIDIPPREDDIDRRDRWSVSRRATIEDAIQGPATTRVFDYCGVGRSLQTEVPIIGTAVILSAANG